MNYLHGQNLSRVVLGQTIEYTYVGCFVSERKTYHVLRRRCDGILIQELSLNNFILHL